jgi:hypothetical protein
MGDRIQELVADDLQGLRQKVWAVICSLDRNPNRSKVRELLLDRIMEEVYDHLEIVTRSRRC